jgi:hypothetical protein
VFKRARRPILVAVLTAVAAMALPALASAASYVSNSAPAVLGGQSCAQPGFSKIQEAITAGSSTIDICAGTYTEQLTITKAAKLTAIDGAGTATVAMPAAAVNSTTSCDTMVGEQMDEISICTPGTVSITGLNVEAIIPTSGCGGQLYGIFVGDGGTLKSTNQVINGASTNVAGLKGCQYGVAVEVGNKTPAEVGKAVLNKDTISGYQKNGPTVKSSGSTLTVNASTITGEGPSPTIAQNGVEVAYGARGNIKSSTISDNECEVVGVCSPTEIEEQATGVLFYQAAAGSSVVNSTVKENDLGAYYSSGSPVVPATADVTLSKDVFTTNRYEGILLEEGKASLKTDTVNGSGLRGIDLFQQAAQQSRSESSATHTKISGQTEASIKVESDQSASDTQGKFVFANGTAAAPVLINENPSKFEIIF